MVLHAALGGMVEPTVTTTGVLELHWWTDESGITRYALYSRSSLGQLATLSSYEQAPFDTCVDVAQWAWRAIARHVRPSEYDRR